jgi:hypothetical protein
MWLIPVIVGSLIAYKLLSKPSAQTVGHYNESQEILKEYNDMLEKLDASPYGPFARLSDKNAALTWTSPTGQQVVITVAKNQVFNKLMGEITLRYKGHVLSETTVLSNNSPPPSKQVVPILARMLRAYAR